MLPFNFKVLKTDDIAVFLKTADGVASEIPKGSGFSVSLNTNQDAFPGGHVTLSGIVPSTSTVEVISDAPYLQPVKLTNLGTYLKTLNVSLDRFEIQIQQLHRRIAILEQAGVIAQTPVKTPQTIAWTDTPAVAVGGAQSLTATSSSGLPVTYTSSDVTKATVVNGVLTGVAQGSVTITASQGGDGTYAPATQVSKTFTVSAATGALTQIITWGQVLSLQVGQSVALTASAPGGAIVYASSNTSVATVSGNMVTAVGVGSATITANQGGNSTYAAAAQISNTASVSAAAFSGVTVSGPVAHT